MDYAIRPASLKDSDGISRVIIAALRETNAKDYPAAVISRVEQSFSPASVSELLARRLVLVAEDCERIIGTASLYGRMVRAVFVDPKHQCRGVGKALMSAVEGIAVERGIAVLAVPSSVTAEPFYVKLGFTSVRDSYHGEERTIVMERPLQGSKKGR